MELCNKSPRIKRKGNFPQLNIVWNFPVEIGPFPSIIYFAFKEIS